MLFKLLILPAISLLMYAYRLRGGGYKTFSGDFMPRAIWAASLAAGYAMIANLNINLIYLPTLLVTGYLSVALVPHAYCQNMGRWPTPQKKWPSFFLPTIADATWTAWPMWKRTGYDFISMTAVGLIRGLMVFLPYAIIALTFNHALFGAGALFSKIINFVFGIKIVSYHALSAAFADAVIGLLSAVAYLVGWYVPVTFPSDQAKSTEWGETLTGLAWAIALIVLAL